jgi:peptidoglycan/LPS O-acetylase OafA/YrhL
MNHYLSLDGLRAYSVLLVLLFHARILSLGWMGVHIFFVLSGFLITSILIKEINSTNYYKAFYGRRILRIFPVYYLVFVLAIILGYIQKSPLRDALSYVFYFQNIRLGTSNFNSSFPRAFDHSWSLAVEEQFYLVFPFIVRLFFAQLKIILGIFILIGVAFLFILPLKYPGSDINWTNPVSNFVFLGAGAFVATIKNKVTFIKVLLPFSVAGISLMLLSHYPVLLRTESGALFLIALTPLILLLVCVLLTIENNFIKLIFQNRIVIYTGRISYGIYIFHYPIFTIADQYSISWPLKFIATFFVAAASWHLFEKKILAFKWKFDYKREIAAPSLQGDLIS